MKIDSKGALQAINVLNKVADSSDKVSEKASKAESSVGNLDETFGKLNLSALASMAGVTALVAGFNKLTGAVSSFISNSVKSFAQFEGLQKSLGVTIGDVTKGLTEFEELKKYANETPYTVTGLADVASQLHAVGIGAEETMEMLKRFGDVALGDSNKMSRIAQNYAQIMSVGKTSAVDTKQFAMMGLPIYDMFKKIGVEGNATAEQVKQAFVMMTEEGGKFFNGMEMGKDSLNVVFNQFRGQVDSLNATFGSLFADETKIILSRLTEMVKNIESVMGQLNNHPVVKSLISGLFLTAITSLAGVIVGALVPAIISVVGAINPVGAGLGLIMGALAGLGGTLAIAGAETELYASKNRDASDSLETLTKKAEQLKKTISGNSYTLEDVINYGNADEESLEKKLSELKAGFAKDRANSGYDADESQFEYERKLIAEVEREIRERQEINAQVSRLSTYNEDVLRSEKAITAEIENQNRKRKEIEDILGKYNKKDSQLKELEAQLKTLKALRESNYKTRSRVENSYSVNGITYSAMADSFTSYDRSEVENAIKELTDQIRELTKEGWTWATLFKDATGKDASQYGFDPKTAVSKYSEALGKVQKASNPLAERESILQDSKYRREYNGKLEAYTGLLAKRDQLQSARDKMEESLSGKDPTTDEYKKTKDALDEFNKEIKGSNSELEKQAEAVTKARQKMEIFEGGLSGLSKVMMEKAREMSNDGNKAGGTAMMVGSNIVGALGQNEKVGAVAQGAMQGGAIGGPWGAIIGALVGLLTKLESFTDLLDAVEKLLDPLVTILNPIIDGLMTFVDLIQTFVEVVQPIFNLIGSIIKVFNSFGKVFNKLVRLLNSIEPVVSSVMTLFEKLADALSWVANKILGFFGIKSKSSNDDDALKEQQEAERKQMELEAEQREAEIERLKEVNKQMDTLNGTLKHQIDYYYEMRQQMDSAFLNDELGRKMNTYTSFQDGIVTPQGYISTHPDDYIIATKNPSAMGGGNGGINVTVNNNASDAVSANVSTTSKGELMIEISRKIASDVASGANGWDGAFNSRNNRLNGRRIM